MMGGLPNTNDGYRIAICCDNCKFFDDQYSVLTCDHPNNGGCMSRTKVRSGYVCNWFEGRESYIRQKQKESAQEN